jgi:hypothetical protein
MNGYAKPLQRHPVAVLLISQGEAWNFKTAIRLPQHSSLLMIV